MYANCLCDFFGNPTFFFSKTNLWRINLLPCDCSLSFKKKKKRNKWMCFSLASELLGFLTWCAYWMKTQTHSAFVSRFHLILSLPVHSVIAYHLLVPLSWGKQPKYLASWDLKTLFCYVNHAILMMYTLCQLTTVNLYTIW